MSPRVKIFQASRRVGFVEQGKIIPPQSSIGAACRAIELDELDGLAHSVLGLVHFRQGRHDLALAEQRRAMELNPSAITAQLGYGQILAHTGQAQDGIAFIERALLLNLRDPRRWSQLDVAANRGLQSATPLARTGHAIEFRINAEDPDQDFKPSPGLVTRLDLPEGEGIRVDTHLSAGDRIPPHYDSMIAKLIVSGASRDVCIERAMAALQHTVVAGVPTNLALHERILRWSDFRSGRYDTRSLERWLEGGA